MKIWIGLPVLSFLIVTGCASGPSGGKQEISAPGAAQAVPVITNSFAARQMFPGHTWKVYLNAQDPNGTMRRIACTIDQPGIGTYPVAFLKIPGPYQKDLSGYIYLNTLRTQGLNFVNINLSVQIQDRNGAFSTPANFPLSFDLRAPSQPPPPPGVFQETDLGPILITLRTLKEQGTQPPAINVR